MAKEREAVRIISIARRTLLGIIINWLLKRLVLTDLSTGFTVYYNQPTIETLCFSFTMKLPECSTQTSLMNEPEPRDQGATSCGIKKVAKTKSDSWKHWRQFVWELKNVRLNFYSRLVIIFSRHKHSPLGQNWTYFLVLFERIVSRAAGCELNNLSSASA